MAKVVRQLPSYDIRSAMALSGEGIHLVDSHCHIDFIFRRLTPCPSSFSNFFSWYRSTFPNSLHSIVAVFCQPKIWGKVR